MTFSSSVATSSSFSLVLFILFVFFLYKKKIE